MGKGPSLDENGVTLEGTVRTCALIAATLHGSDIKLGPEKHVGDAGCQITGEADVLIRGPP